jgi:hypothetical protein
MTDSDLIFLYRIRNKNGNTAIDLLPDDGILQPILRKYQAQASVSRDDIASGAFFC